MDSNSEIQGYNMYPMLHLRRKFSSGVTVELGDELGDEGERIFILDGYSIQSTVVLD